MAMQKQMKQQIHRHPSKPPVQVQRKNRHMFTLCLFWQISEELDTDFQKIEELRSRNAQSQQKARIEWQA